MPRATTFNDLRWSKSLTCSMSLVLIEGVSVQPPHSMKIKAGLKFRLEADVDDYKQMLRDGWAGSMDGLVEQIGGDTVFVRLVDGQAWRFLLKNFEEVTTPYDWEGEIMWD